MAIRVTLPRQRHDAGMTLLELIVALGLFTVLLSIFVGGIVGFARATTEARVDAQTSSAVGTAIKRVEKSVRYANALNYPGVVSEKSYVEWRTDAVSSPTGTTTCTQLRYIASTGTISMRTWADGASASTGTWSVILRGVRGAATTSSPFLTIAAGANSNYQGLELIVATGLSDRAGTTASSTVYAKNSSVNSVSNPINASSQSQTPVCAPSGYRP